MSLEMILEQFFLNFSIIMLVVAVLLAVACWLKGRGNPKARSLAGELLRWTLLVAVGFTGIFTFFAHVFMPDRTAANIGWETSPFQFEVGIADLTVGVLGVIAFWCGFGFRAAAAIAAIVWYGGDAIGHVRQMIVANNFAPGNAGPWFWTDVLLPILFLWCLWACRRTPAGQT